MELNDGGTDHEIRCHRCGWRPAGHLRRWRAGPMVQDTALLDFINEVQMYYTGAQVSATALTSMTSQMRAGTIRKCDMASIYTYQNTLYKLQMNGWQLPFFHSAFVHKYK